MEEIHFFKVVKPQFTSQLIYFAKLFTIESARPAGSEKMKRKYLQQQLLVLNEFLEEHREFYQYFKSGASHLDDKYFVHGEQKLSFLSGAPPVYYGDANFNSSRDMLVAEMLATELLVQYLLTEISVLSKKEITPMYTQPGADLTLSWTASKAALVELIYALASTGTFNNGNVDVKDIATLFEQIGHIDLGNYYRSFQEIRIRKKSRTSFLDQLKEKLVQRMDQSDEHPHF